MTLQRDGDSDYPEQLKACHLRCAKRTLRTLEKNGSIFIKLGQHLSSMNYLLPNEWCDTFIPLQDQCPVSSLASIEDMVRRDTGHELSDYFSEFDESPIGAASLAQVHRATERATGHKVAVKVQHPALDEWAKLDLALTSFTFTTLKRWFPEYDLTWLSEEMQASLPQELDFTREGQNATRAREYFANIHDAPVVIPRVVWAKRRILVMEYVAGFRTDDVASLDAHGIDRDEVSAALARVFNEMIFGRDAPLHCDPHGGNISIRPNGKRHGRANFDVVLYDHGLYRDIPLQLRRDYAKLWLAVLDADEAGMRRYAHAVAGIDEAHFPLFASAITGRDYTVLAKKAGGTGGVMTSRTNEEKKVIGDALGEGLLESLIQLLGQVPRVILLILKTNDLSRLAPSPASSPPPSLAGRQRKRVADRVCSTFARRRASDAAGADAYVPHSCAIRVSDSVRRAARAAVWQRALAEESGGVGGGVVAAYACGATPALVRDVSGLEGSGGAAAGGGGGQLPGVDRQCSGWCARSVWSG